MQVTIRPLAETDLADADRIFRLAFGTFLALPDPMSFSGDAQIMRSRWLADPSAAFAAYIGHELVGSSFAAKWGSFGVFGPVTVRPDLWDKGIARRRLEAAIARFADWQTKQLGLVTFPWSAQHVALYQKYGFWPQYLTPVMSKPVESAPHAREWICYSDLPADARSHCLRECADLTDTIFSGLDLRREITALLDQGIGETILIRERDALVGFAVCHMGKGSEAETATTTYVKFAAVRSGPDAPRHFADLLDACESLAAPRGATQVLSAVNSAANVREQTPASRRARCVLPG
jgi:GNAT superfamily N-acetyltransferase